MNGDKLKEHTEEIKRHISVLKEDFDSQVKTVAEQYGSIEQKLDNNAKLMNKTTEDVAVIKMDIEFIKNSLKKKVDLEEFEALERRVGVLEAKV